ncbi:MAG: acetate non-utilizing protein 9 [Peltula sp. TS41687]|nr:MAG: acetate non-utilizing protein 9 [Peltula sp. TS41687]
MKVSTRLFMATPIVPGSRAGFKNPPLALLPPIPLYRRLLRAHRRKLPKHERVLGDEYVKGEFRRHRDVENPIHIIGFLTEWQMYAQAIEGDSWQGTVLDRSKIDKMSDDQLTQLYELMQAIKSKQEP